jgi:hypothetical protein
MQARRGLSLTEVLIAIFVMAIGMIALLVLFPLGMLNMAWALKNNRTAQAIGDANAVADLPMFASGGGTATRFNLRDDPWYTTLFKNSGLYQQLFNTTQNNWTFNPQDPSTALALYVDPIGDLSLASPNPGSFVGGANQFNIPGLPPIPPGTNGFQVGVPRVSSTLAGNMMGAKNWCSQEDDVTFNLDGSVTVDQLSPVVERGRRYSWAYVCRWPRMSDLSVVQMSVVIYSARPSPLALNNGQIITTEPTYLGGGGFPAPNPKPAFWDVLAFLQGSTTATLAMPPSPGNPGGGMPWPAPVKRGDWIFDNTQITPNDVTQPMRFVSGYFYKVIGISDPYVNSIGKTVQDVQLDRPARTSGFSAVVLKNVVDVRDKSDGRMPVR